MLNPLSKTTNCTPHNTDGPARTAAAAAQARADDSYTLAAGKVDASGAATAAREVTVDWAESDNSEPIPAPKLVNVVNAHEDIVNVLDGRLPGLPVAMRLGWSQSRMFTELDFDRPLPPIGGSIAGMSDGLAAPPFPPAIASDPTLFLGIWLAGDPDVAELPAGFAVADKSAITVDGAAGVYFASTERLPASVAGDVFKVFLVGDRALSRNPILPPIPAIPMRITSPRPRPAPGGGGESLPGLRSRRRKSGSCAQQRLWRSTRSHSRTAHGRPCNATARTWCARPTARSNFSCRRNRAARDNSVSPFAKIPAADSGHAYGYGEMPCLRWPRPYSNNSATLLAIPHGANRGVKRGSSGNGPIS